jgi:hypothetical protein
MPKALHTIALLLALASPPLAEGPDDAFNPNARPLKIDKTPRPAVTTPPRTVGHEAPPIAPQDQQDTQDPQGQQARSPPPRRSPATEFEPQDAQGWPPADDTWLLSDMTERLPACGLCVATRVPQSRRGEGDAQAGRGLAAAALLRRTRGRAVTRARRQRPRARVSR